MKKSDAKKRGLLLAPDDLEVGKYIAAHSIKGSDEPQPFFGMAAQIKAINLPFVVIQPVNGVDTATIDIRYLNLMPVTQEFVQAQAQHRPVTIENELPTNAPHENS